MQTWHYSVSVNTLKIILVREKILYFVKNLTGMAKQTGLHFTVNEQQINHCIESEFLAAFHTFPMKGSLVFQCLPSDDNTWSFHANS